VKPIPSKQPEAASRSLLLGAAALAASAWFVPVLSWAFMPLQYLNTHLHEFSHAFTSIITGGQVDHIEVASNGSGLTFTVGGIQPLITSAGYVGSACIGAAMLALAGTEKGAKIALRGVACILVASMVFWVRGDLVGIVAGLIWAPILWILGGVLKGRTRIFAAQFFGIAECLAAVQAFLILFNYSLTSTQDTDAKIMQSMTGVPGVIWATVWFVISMALMASTLRFAWRRMRG